MVASYFLDMAFPCLGKFLKPLPYCKKLRYWCSCSGLRKIPHNAWSNGMSAKKYLSLSMDLAKQGSYLVCGYFMVAVASLGKAKQRNQSLSHHVRWMKAKYVNERLGWAWRIPSACHASLPEAARRIVLFLLLIIHPCWIYMVLRLGHQQTIIIRTLHNHLIIVQGILLSLTGSKPAPNLRFKILSNIGQVPATFDDWRENFHFPFVFLLVSHWLKLHWGHGFSCCLPSASSPFTRIGNRSLDRCSTPTLGFKSYLLNSF